MDIYPNPFGAVIRHSYVDCLKMKLTALIPAFMESPDYSRSMVLLSIAMDGVNKEYPIGLENEIGKVYFDILNRLHHKMKNGEWINESEEKIIAITDIDEALKRADEIEYKFNLDVRHAMQFWRRRYALTKNYLRELKNIKDHTVVISSETSTSEQDIKEIQSKMEDSSKVITIVQKSKKEKDKFKL